MRYILTPYNRNNSDEDLIGDVIKVLVQVHDNRHLKTKAMGLANQRSIFG